MCSDDTLGGLWSLARDAYGAAQHGAGLLIAALLRDPVLTEVKATVVSALAHERMPAVPPPAGRAHRTATPKDRLLGLHVREGSALAVLTRHVGHMGRGHTARHDTRSPLTPVRHVGDKRWAGVVLGTSQRLSEPGETLGDTVHVYWLSPTQFIGLARPDDLEVTRWPFALTW